MGDLGGRKTPDPCGSPPLRKGEEIGGRKTPDPCGSPPLQKGEEIDLMARPNFIISVGLLPEMPKRIGTRELMTARENLMIEIFSSKVRVEASPVVPRIQRALMPELIWRFIIFSRE